MKKQITILTGAGISAESGLKTFRDANGLWEGHDVMQVASPKGFAQNPALVLEFYNQRRRQLLQVTPNQGHKALVLLEKKYQVQIITQNVDNLHEQAGSTNVLHLHGELCKVRSTVNENYVKEWFKDLVLGDVDPQGNQLRPHIVWFGEMVPLLEQAITITRQSDIVVIIGTSMQVYPAANLINYAPSGVPIYFIDPKPNITPAAYPNLHIMAQTATQGMPSLAAKLLDIAL